jgi:hypothetical protein
LCEPLGGVAHPCGFEPAADDAANFFATQQACLF